MNNLPKLERMGFTISYHTGYVVAQKGNNRYIDKDLKTLTNLVLSYVINPFKENKSRTIK